MADAPAAAGAGHEIAGARSAVRKGALSYTMGAFPLSGGRVRGRGGRRGYRLKIKKNAARLSGAVSHTAWDVSHHYDTGRTAFLHCVQQPFQTGSPAEWGICRLKKLRDIVSGSGHLGFLRYYDFGNVGIGRHLHGAGPGVCAVDRPAYGAVAYLIQLIGLLPWVISMMVGTVLWRWILNGDTGLFNYFLRCLGIAPVAIFENKTASLVTLIVVMAWRTIGYSMVMILAGLKGVDKGLLEAARVDGANTWQALCASSCRSLKRPCCCPPSCSP